MPQDCHRFARSYVLAVQIEGYARKSIHESPVGRYGETRTRFNMEPVASEHSAQRRRRFRIIGYDKCFSFFIKIVGHSQSPRAISYTMAIAVPNGSAHPFRRATVPAYTTTYHGLMKIKGCKETPGDSRKKNHEKTGT